MTFLQTRRSSAAKTKPMIGEKSSDLPTFPAWPQSTPLVAAPLAAMSWLAMPTPRIDPMRVCELDEGNPNHHVPRFHTMAAASSANTMAKPAPLPTCRMSSTGKSETMPKATAPDDTRTPMKFHAPDHMTAMFGSSVWV